MFEETVVIKNKTGLHARPASLFVRKANSFKSEIKIEENGKEVNAKSIMGVLSLGVSQGKTVKIKAEGEDEMIAVKELIKLIRSFED